MSHRRHNWPIGSQSGNGRRNWWVVLGLGLLLQVPLFAAFLAQTSPDERMRSMKKKVTVMTGRLAPLKKTPKEDPAEKLPEDAQIVEVPKVTFTPKTPPVKTKFVADRKVRVKKQTRSRKRAKLKPHRKTLKEAPSKESKVRSAASKSTEPTATPKGAQKLALVQPRQKLPPAKRGQKSSKSLLFKGAKSRLLLPATSTKNALANLQTLGGSGLTDDHLRNVKEGKQTLLNANKYKFADFFYRVKDAIRRHWSPRKVYRQRDPTGRVYGVKDRHTVVRIVLNPKGKLLKISLRKRCGLNFLDAEAKRAVRQAGPFRNPPTELIKKGKITFDFGFYFEISSGRHRFKWRRL